MIKTKLNINNITTQQRELGYNQTSIADKLGVSRESVSQWFSGDNFPRARHLLKLGEILQLTYSDLVNETSDGYEPIFAFSAAHKYRHTEEDKQKVTDIGYALEKLIPYLIGDMQNRSFKNTLLSPKNDIEYIEQIVIVLKKKYQIVSHVAIKDIDKILRDYNAHLVPVLWGSEDNTSNGIHIKLPESGTDWIYINLDSFIYDFKFWILHELAHLLSPDFQPIEESEDFANNFAAEFLFSIKDAKIFYDEIVELNIDDVKIRLFDKGMELLISPYTIYKQVNKYLELNKLQKYDIPEVVNSFMNYLPGDHKKTVAEMFIQKVNSSAKEYLTLIETEFDDLFVNALMSYYRNEKFSIGFIRNIFHISLQDAQNIFDEIVKRNKTVVSNH
ncbi:MAG: helix-turn-helix domain-containing protein [Melioribacteraceae bacterium]